MPRSSESDQRGTSDLPGARNTYRQSVDPMELSSGSEEGGRSSTTVGGSLYARSPPPPYTQCDDSLAQRPIERYIRADGMVGLIVSQGIFGSWSTRVGLLLDPSNPANSSITRRMQEVAIFDKDIVAAVLAGDIPRAKVIGLMKMGWPSRFCPDDMELRIKWVALGDEFEIADGPGYEFVRLKKAIDWWRA